MIPDQDLLASHGYRLVENGRRSYLALAGFEQTRLVNELPLRTGEAMPGREARPLAGRKLAVSVGIDGLDGRFVVRRLAHGGRLARLTGEVFCGRVPRPFGEVRASVLARRAGVATPEIVVAGVRRLAGLFYTGTVVTREIEGAANLWDALASARQGEEALALFRAAGAAIRRLHDATILHADLNLKNLLVKAAEGGRTEVLILDLDKARAGRALSLAERRTNLRRLLRSTRKLARGGGGATVGRDGTAALVEGYGARLVCESPLEIGL